MNDKTTDLYLIGLVSGEPITAINQSRHSWKFSVPNQFKLQYQSKIAASLLGMTYRDNMTLENKRIADKSTFGFHNAETSLV